MRVRGQAARGKRLSAAARGWSGFGGGGAFIRGGISRMPAYFLRQKSMSVFFDIWSGLFLNMDGGISSVCWFDFVESRVLIFEYLQVIGCVYFY
ncbi:hypothetical protein VA599_15650 [Chromobacterium sp. TRC.1.1.SA]|uniref:Uncharacterized protein n=1 Tax=Chromobacterium indicum TaxID=3110228 RepID=A0ABV0CM99_9NEIS